MSSAQRIFGGVAWSLIYNIINAVYGFVSVPLLLNYFGKGKYGLIGIAISVNVYLRILDMGFSSGNVKFFASFLARKDKQAIKKLFQTSLFFYLIIGFINAIILAFLSVYSQQIFNLSHSDDEIFKNLLLILIISSIGVWTGSVMEQFLRANELVGWQQRVMLFTKISQVLILAIVIYFRLDILQFFILNTATSLINIPFYVLKINRLSLEISYRPKYDKKLMNEILPYCLSIFSFGLFQFSANYLRPVLLGIKLGVESVSDFRIIEGFANLILILGSSFIGVILPLATKVKELGDDKKEHQIANDGTKYITIFISFLIFGFVLVSKELMFLYVGKSYEHLVFWLNIWIFSLLSMHISALSSLVFASNSLRPIVYMSAFSTVLSLLLSWILIDYFALGGVVISYLVYVICQVGFYYLYYYPYIMKYESFSIFRKSFLEPISITAVSYFMAILIFNHININNVFIEILIKEFFFVITALIGTCFFILKKQDFNFIQSLLPVSILTLTKKE